MPTKPPVATVSPSRMSCTASCALTTLPVAAPRRPASRSAAWAGAGCMRLSWRRAWRTARCCPPRRTPAMRDCPQRCPAPQAVRPGSRLQRLRGERVALGEAAAGVAALEPALALRTAAVGEAVGHDLALAAPLQRVVADLRGGVHRLFQVALLEPVLAALRVVRPHAGETVGLQLDANGDGVHLRLADTPAHAFDLGRDAEQVLHVVAHLVRDDVGLREVARRTELAVQRVEEAEVDVDLLVARAIERAHRRLAHAAGAARGATEQHQLGLAVGGTTHLHQGTPHVFRVGEHGGDERGLRVARRRRGGRRLGRWRGEVAAAQDAEQRKRVDAEDPSRHQRHHDGAQADAAPASETGPPTCGAAVLDVAALPLAFPLHGGLPGVRRSRRRRTFAPSGLGQRDTTLPLVLAAAVLVARLADLVALEEQHLRAALAGVDLGRQRRGVAELQRHVPFPLGLERGDVDDDAAARVSALAEADRQHGPRNAEVLDGARERERVRRDDADVTGEIDEGVRVERLGIDDRRVDVGEDLEFARAADVVTVAGRAVAHDLLAADLAYLTGLEGLDHPGLRRHAAYPLVALDAHVADLSPVVV